jgi:hypothetical protein
LAISLILLLGPRIMARILPPPPPPDSTPPVIIVTDEPTPTPTPTPQPDVLATATIYFADATQVSVQSANGRFQLIGLHLNEAVSVVVQFPPGWGNTPVALQRLDGGNVSAQAGQITIASDGTASFQFHVGNQPGLYRISMDGAGTSSMLSFWVIDPGNLQAKPPVANPSP